MGRTVSSDHWERLGRLLGDDRVLDERSPTPPDSKVAPFINTGPAKSPVSAQQTIWSVVLSNVRALSSVRGRPTMVERCTSAVNSVQSLRTLHNAQVEQRESRPSTTISRAPSSVGEG